MYCVRCGTLNPEGQADCQECGAELQPVFDRYVVDARRCPMCASANVPDALYCANCGAHLQLLADSEQDAEQDDYSNWSGQEDYSNWGVTQTSFNQRATMPSEPRDKDEQNNAANNGAGGSSDMSWLSALRASAGDPADADQVQENRYSGSQSGSNTPQASSGSGSNSQNNDDGSEVPDWLRRLRSRMASEPEPEPKPTVIPRMPEVDPALNRPNLQSRLGQSKDQPIADQQAPQEPSSAAPWLNSELDAAGADDSDRYYSQSPNAAGSFNTPALPDDLATPDWLRNAASNAAGAGFGDSWQNDWPSANTPAAQNTPPAASENSAQQDDDGLPSWMNHKPAAQESANNEAASSLPAWLSNLTNEPEQPAAPAQQEAQPVASVQPPAAPEPPSATVPPNNLQTTVLPDWLQENSAAPSTIGSTPTSDLPAWLHQETGRQNGPAPAGNADNNLPAWLRDLNEPATPAPAAPPPAPKPRGGRGTGPLRIEETDLPSWMTGSSAPEPQPVEPPAVQLPATPVAQTPTPVAQTPTPVAPTPAPTTPQALRPAAPVTPAPTTPANQPPKPAPTTPAPVVYVAPVSQAPSQPTTAPAPTQPSASAPAQPQVTPPSSTTPVTPPATADSAATTALPSTANIPLQAPRAVDQQTPSFFSDDDLPAWLRAIETDPSAPAPAPEDPGAPAEPAAPAGGMPNWLQTLRGTFEEDAPIPMPAIMASPIAEPLVATQPVQMVNVRQPREGAVDLLNSLLAPAVAQEAAPVIKAAPSRMSWLSADRIVYAALLLVVILMYLLKPLNASSAQAPSTNYGAGFYNTLNTLPTTKPVLLVYDWDGSRYAEMSQLSLSVTRYMQASKHNFATMSLLPEGSGFAQQVTSEVYPNTDCGGGVYGVNYVNLGYFPGNEAAIAGFSGKSASKSENDFVCNQPVSSFPLMNNMGGLAQFGAIVLLSGSDNSVRLWAEQLSAVARGVPMVVAAPEALRPAAEPYLQSSRFVGALFGISGAQELEQRGLPGANASDLGRMMQTQSAAVYVLALALLIGFFFGAYRWINRPDK